MKPSFAQPKNISEDQTSNPKKKKKLNQAIQEFQKYWSITALVCKITYFNGRNINLVGLYSQILVWLHILSSQ